MECNTTTVSTRRVAAVIPPACRYGAAWITRAANNNGQNSVQQLPHTHASVTGGGYTGVAVSAADSPLSGTDIYLQTDATQAMTECTIAPTGTTIDDLPIAQMDRALAVPEGLAARVEVYEFKQMAGASLQFWNRTGDLEAL